MGKGLGPRMAGLQRIGLTCKISSCSLHVCHVEPEAEPESGPALRGACLASLWAASASLWHILGEMVPGRRMKEDRIVTLCL